MKKFYLVFIILISFLNSNAQGVKEALQYSIIDMNGTARFRALSGAFGALGGDLSAISINPASSVVFANNQFAFTLNNRYNGIRTQYFETNTNTNTGNLTFNQIGGVFVFENNNKYSDWNKFALALNYDDQANFKNTVAVLGENPINSIDKYFLNHARGMRFSDIAGLNYDQMGFTQNQVALGYRSQLLDYDTVNNVFYANVSHASDGKKYTQQSYITNTGYNGKLAFNFSTEYDKKWMLGLNLNAHFSDYTQQKTFTEKNDKAYYSKGATINEVLFYNELTTKGSGFSFQVGAIYKPVAGLRLGLTYESPTWMVLEDQLIQRISTSGVVVKPVGGSTTYSPVVNKVDPRTTIIFAPYTVVTPSKWSFSGGYVFGKQGFISFDYSVKDYSSIIFKPINQFNNPNENNSNNIFSNLFRTSNEFRVGVEKKIKQWSLRGGYRYEESPYKDKSLMGDLVGFSGGFGYNWGGTKLDFAFSTSKRNYKELIFEGIPDFVSYSRRNNNATLTLSFEL
ncbi:OmpP1/FadL family transporter [Flavobacterium columnare]|uniref:Transporter n=1 Tax=Flavobacterium columnare TaxID=996 RepID=A0AAI8CFX9_9FLAO|nr:outer membrane protein transport protein [Flavobacterium columnare]AMO19988.1 transporter [Flavobacterium columnare]QOG57001.1 outer membrane protein transport protein [Flavobacterium columnare]QOG59725.1 outer membrane protein transport protein [Flavobacterium columnare]QOG62445.1 outer membrane protein transport protein [Flavobacterium columnare]QOG65169.1 outer membrane protein transport protein [Flavobacterium columnare]